MTPVFNIGIQQLTDLIESAVGSFDFTITGRAGGSLGRDLVVRAATGIADRSSKANDPDGNPWRANVPKYAAYKRKRYGVYLPGELSGQMLSLLSLVGRPTVTKNEIIMTYGLVEPPRRSTSRTGVSLRSWELKATDTDKAEWFTDGGRRFYELDNNIELSLVELCGERLADYLTEKGL